MDQAPDWKKVFRTTTLVCVAIIGSLFIYAVIVEILKSRLIVFPGLYRIPLDRSLLYAFYGLAILAVVLTRFVNRTLTKGRENERFEERVLRLSRASIVTAVLAEVPALLGFVLFLLSGSSRHFYWLWFCSLVLEFIFFPRLKAWESWLEHPGSPV